MIEKRPFGRSGHMSSVALFGAAGLKAATQEQADRTLEVLLEYGVNHIDTAPRYGDAELRIGPWMAEHRKDFFLATKTGQRTYQGARDEFHRSLERLRVDQRGPHPDARALPPATSGTWRWARAVRSSSWSRRRSRGSRASSASPATAGPSPPCTAKSLARYDFDSVLMPYNFLMAQNERYMDDFESVMRVCQQRNVAVQTIKSIARGPWATSEPNRATWYQPLEEPGRHRSGRALGDGPRRHLLQHRGRHGSAAEGARCGHPLSSAGRTTRRCARCSRGGR